MNLLIVEDEVLIQKSLVKLLQKKGANAEGVSSGREAIKLIQEKSFDRIICDLMLQDITGFDVIESCIKFLPKNEIQGKFVLMTAYSSEQVLSKAKEYGCPVMRKPFENLDEVLEIMLNS